jgi:hypothetical protein
VQDLTAPRRAPTVEAEEGEGEVEVEESVVEKSPAAILAARLSSKVNILPRI